MEKKKCCHKIVFRRLEDSASEMHDGSSLGCP